MTVVLMALGAAALFGASSVLMHSKARAAPAAQSLHPGLLIHLARQPVWLAGIGAQTAGFGLQAVALEMGSLTLVQALIPTGLLLMQSSFQAGDIEWSLPALTVVNPVVSVVLGTTAFHEGITAAGLLVVALAVSLGFTVTGVVLLARSPALVAIHEQPVP